jgi:hypothetical protein
VNIEFHPVLMNVERAESANLIHCYDRSISKPRYQRLSPRCCGESAIKPNRLEIS